MNRNAFGPMVGFLALWTAVSVAVASEPKLTEMTSEQKQEALLAFLNWLPESKEDVQCQHALSMLADVDHTVVTPALLRALREAPSIVVKSQIAEAIGTYHVGTATEGLLATLDDPDEYNRAEAARTLGYLRETRAIPKLEGLLDKKDWPSRLGATQALGYMKSPMAVPGLRRALRDEYWMTRSSAVSAVEENQHREALPELRDVFYNDPAESVRWEAARALAKFGDRGIADTVLQLGDALLQRDIQSSEVSQSELLVEAIGLLGDIRAMPILTKLLGNRNIMLRHRVAIAIGQLNSPFSFDRLVDVLKSDSDDFVRGGALEGLGYLHGNGQVFDILVTALKEGSHDEKRGAVLGLGHLRDPRARSMLEGLRNTGPEFSREVEEALAHQAEETP